MESFKFVGDKVIPHPIPDCIEKKAYYSDASSEALEAMKNRVFVYEPGVIYYKELPIVTPFTSEWMLSRAEELGKGFDSAGIIVDLRETGRPNAKARRAVNEKFQTISSYFNHISFFTEGIIMNTSIRFVMYGLDLQSYSVNRNFDTLINELREIVKA